MSRHTFRWRAVAALAVAGALALTGCAGTSTTSSSSSSDSAAEGAFPVTIDTMYGEATIDAKPERVATYGWGATDAALALGVVPVAIAADSYSGGDSGIAPWVQTALDELGAETPTLLDESDLSVEALLATDPDVLIAPYSGITQEQYDQITAAGVPVVAPAEALWATPWRDVITETGAALGLDDEAAALLDDLDGQIADAAAAHPEFEGTTIAFAADDVDTFYLYLPADARVEILEDLGFTSAPSVQALDTGEATFYTTVSEENLDQIDAQVILVYAADEDALNTFLTSTRTSVIPAVKTGAVAAIVGNQDSGALSPTALTIPYILPTMVDALAEATAKAQG